MLIDDELHRARTAVAHRQRRGHGIAPHGLAHGGADHRGRRFFNHLLPASLGRAVALAQVDRVAVRVRKHLYFDVAAVVYQALQHQGAIAECADRFPAGAFQTGLQFGVAAHEAHAASTATGHGFHQQWVA